MPVEHAEPLRFVDIVDENGELLLEGDGDRRFFEASWMHKYQGKYYFSYSTGDTHFLCYAIGDNPYGPFMDDPPLHRRMERQVVAVLPRLHSIRRCYPPAECENDRDYL